MKRTHLLVGAGLLCIVSILVAVGGPPNLDPKGTWELSDQEQEEVSFTPPEIGNVQVVNDGPGTVTAFIVEGTTVVHGPVQISPQSSATLPMTPEQKLVIADIADPNQNDSAGTWEWL